MKMDNLVPVLAAIISAVALLWGYAYQKGKEADAEILKKQQEIYSNLITNITTRNSIMGHILDSPAYIAASEKERKALRDADPAAAAAIDEEMGDMFNKDPASIENRNQRTEIVALLCLYGTDEAIKAYSDFSAKAIGPNTQIDDVGELIVALRRSLTNKHQPSHTLITAREANLGIWWEKKFLPVSTAAK
jgi:hypothetical protein